MPFDPSAEAYTAFVLKTKYTGGVVNNLYKTTDWTFGNDGEPTWEDVNPSLPAENIFNHMMDANRTYFYYITYTSSLVRSLYSLNIDTGTNTLILDYQDAYAILSGTMSGDQDDIRIISWCASADVSGKLFAVVLDYSVDIAYVLMSTNYGIDWSILTTPPGQEENPDNTFSNRYPFRFISSRGNYIHLVSEKYDSYWGGKFVKLFGSSDNGQTWSVESLSNIMVPMGSAYATHVETHPSYPERAVIFVAGWDDIINDGEDYDGYLVVQDGTLIYSLSESGYGSDLSYTGTLPADASAAIDWYSANYLNSDHLHYIDGNFNIRRRCGYHRFFSFITSPQTATDYYKTINNDSTFTASAFPYAISCFRPIGTSLAIGCGNGAEGNPIIASIPDESNMNTYYTKVGDMPSATYDIVRGIYIDPLPDLYTGIKVHGTAFEDIAYE